MYPITNPDHPITNSLIRISSVLFHFITASASTNYSNCIHKKEKSPTCSHYVSTMSEYIMLSSTSFIITSGRVLILMYSVPWVNQLPVHGEFPRESPFHSDICNVHEVVNVIQN